MMTETSTKVETGGTIKVITEDTPNPNALKFITAKDFKIQGKATFKHPAECLNVPLASQILQLSSITALHMFENVLTVTQDGEGDWPTLEASIIQIIQAYLPSHDAHFEVEQERDSSSWDDERRRLEEILDHDIRPGLQGDGGDLEVIELVENVLTVRYEGACGSCPSSRSGTLMGIESILREKFNPELQIIAV